MSDILKYPNSSLSCEAEEVVEFDSKLEALSQKMLEVMYDNLGVGLAANQIGSKLKMFVTDHTYATLNIHTPRVFTNASYITLTDYAVKEPEGCLSLPGVTASVRRANSVMLSYTDLNGKNHFERFDGLLAHIIQHEVDHLNGKLFIERLGKKRQDVLYKKYDELVKKSK